MPGNLTIIHKLYIITIAHSNNDINFVYNYLITLILL